jgi:hypothetical protein
MRVENRALFLCCSSGRWLFVFCPCEQGKTSVAFINGYTMVTSEVIIHMPCHLRSAPSSLQSGWHSIVLRLSFHAFDLLQTDVQIGVSYGPLAAAIDASAQDFQYYTGGKQSKLCVRQAACLFATFSSVLECCSLDHAVVVAMLLWLRVVRGLWPAALPEIRWPRPLNCYSSWCVCLWCLRRNLQLYGMQPSGSRSWDCDCERFVCAVCASVVSAPGRRSLVLILLHHLRALPLLSGRLRHGRPHWHGSHLFFALARTAPLAHTLFSYCRLLQPYWLLRNQWYAALRSCVAWQSTDCWCCCCCAKGHYLGRERCVCLFWVCRAAVVCACSCWCSVVLFAGYMRIIRGVNMCGINSQATLPVW